MEFHYKPSSDKGDPMDPQSFASLRGRGGLIPGHYPGADDGRGQGAENPSGYNVAYE